MRRFSLIRAVSVVLAAGMALAVSGTAAQEASFAGKRVNALIGTTPGGGTDLSTRLLGRYMSKHLPGNPQMIYRNMPAGGGVQATNHFANEAARDGTLWMGGGNAYIVAATLRKETVRYNPTRFHFLGGIARGGSVTSMHKDKVAHIHDRSRPPVVIGTTAGADTWVEMLVWAAEHAGWNLRFVVGYPGTGALLIAMKRGEIDAFGTSNLNMLRSLATDGNFVPVLQTGELKDGKVIPQVGYEKVPIITDLVAHKLSGVGAETFDYWIKSNQIDKWYALPPGTPAAVVATYVAAFERATRDPDFLRDGTAQFGEGFFVQSAADLTNIVATTSYPSADKQDYIRAMKVRQQLPAEPLSDAELAALAKGLVKDSTVTATLTGVERDGRTILFPVGQETHKAELSGSRTKVTIAGREGKRGSLKAGMTCRIAYSGSGGEASSVECN